MLTRSDRWFLLEKTGKQKIVQSTLGLTGAGNQTLKLQQSRATFALQVLSLQTVAFASGFMEVVGFARR